MQQNENSATLGFGPHYWAVTGTSGVVSAASEGDSVLGCPADRQMWEVRQYAALAVVLLLSRLVYAEDVPWASHRMMSRVARRWNLEEEAAAMGDPPLAPQEAASNGAWVDWTWDANATQYGGGYGPHGVVSDPAVLYDERAQLYRMYMTCVDFQPPLHLLICGATSVDGVHWETLNTTGGRGNVVKGVVLDYRIDDWDKNLETAFVYIDELERLGAGARYILLCGGYPHAGDNETSDLVMAVSPDGVKFERFQGSPRGAFMPRTPGWYDNDEIFSPTLLTDPTDPSTILMLYCGHCTSNCTAFPGATIGWWTIGATTKDLINWEKTGPIVPWGFNASTWWSIFVGEPGWVFAPDEYYYAFLSGGFVTKPPTPMIGVARSKSPFSGYELSPNPIIVAGPTGSWSALGVFAPSALMGGDPNHTLIRAWYFEGGVFNNVSYAGINEATAPWPIYDG